MPSCVLCGCEIFDEFDGHFFCEKCGTQSQEIRNEAEVEEEFENFGAGNAQQREMKKPRQKPGPKSKFAPTDFGKPWLSFEAFQCLLKAQVAALIKLGVNPVLKDIVCQIWFHFLKRKKVAFTGAAEGSEIAMESMKLKRDLQPGTDSMPLPGRDAKYKSKATSSNADGSDLGFWNDMGEEFYEDDDPQNLQPVSEQNFPDASPPVSDSDNSCDWSQSQSVALREPEHIEPGEMSEPEHIGALHYKLNGKCSWAQLQHRLTIVITYIGLLYAKEPVTAADLLRLISRGKLPFYNIADVLPGHMKLSKDDTAVFLNRPVPLIRIHEGATYIINYLDLAPIPEPNLYLIIAKLVLDLQLPSAVHRLAVALFKVTGFRPRTNFRYHRVAKYNEFYEEISMSFIIIAVKLIYGLDGETERNGKILRSFLDVPLESVECWDCVAIRLNQKRKAAVQDSYPAKEEDLQFVNNCADYSLFCSEQIFKHSSAAFASSMKPGIAHPEYRACNKSAREEYCSIMKQALNDLSRGRAKEQVDLKASSFVFEQVAKEENKNVSCKCKSKQNRDISRPELRVLEFKDAKLEDALNESYLLYLNDLSGLQVHDSYRFLLGICAERILLRPSHLHRYITYVESLLFVDESSS